MLLRQDVTYDEVAAEIQRTAAPAGVWGYGKYWETKEPDGRTRRGWSGTKGLWMTPAWCEEINVMMENTNFEHRRHVDMWLVDLLKKQKARGFLLLLVLAGYGHRVSMSESELGEQKFGGCFLPQKRNARPMRHDDRENYIYRYAPPGIRDWVEACRCELGRPPKRLDVVKATLMLEMPDAKAYIDFGLYKKQDPADVLGQEAAGYEFKIEVPLPS